MSLLFESIKIENGLINHLDLHQNRVNRSLKYLDATSTHNLNEFITNISLPSTGLYKLRISYDLTRIITYSITPYISKKKIEHIKLMDGSHIKYRLKYEDRTSINQLLEEAKADEIIMTDQGYLTDSSYANIIVYDGSNWHTPKTPLLHGVQREYLIKTHQLIPSAIHCKELHHYRYISFINALNPIETAIKYKIDQLKIS